MNRCPLPDRAWLYRALAERYGWTNSEIAAMTPAQQIMHLERDGADGVDYRTGHPTKTFSTMAEAQAFLRSLE